MQLHFEAILHIFVSEDQHLVPYYKLYFRTKFCALCSDQWLIFIDL